MNVVDTIRETIERHELIPGNARIVAGVSGGADSVALLHVFHQAGLPCMVAHLNHQLRGAESDEDEQFVRELAARLDFSFVAKSVDVKALAATSGLSIEMAARQVRHDFFAEFPDAVIALAHHADDQVETFLLKLARGAGTEGLCGMPYFQTLDHLRIIRPMLDLPRAEIMRWLKEGGFTWREDASNSDEQFLRNRVRHTILPLLESELNPNIRETILRTMDILREENTWMEQRVGGASGFVSTERAKPEASSALPLAMRRRVLRRWLFENGAAEADFDAVEKILELMAAGNGTTTFELNNQQRVVVEYGVPRFEESTHPSPEPQWTLTVEQGTGWRKDPGNGIGILPAEASFDACKVGDAPIEVRGYLPGDRMAPFGMEGHRKLQDIFTDHKIPRAQRARIPVVVCRGEIIWLPGYRTARGWEVQDDAGKAVHLHIE